MSVVRFCFYENKVAVNEAAPQMTFPPRKGTHDRDAAFQEYFFRSPWRRACWDRTRISLMAKLEIASSSHWTKYPYPREHGTPPPSDRNLKASGTSLSSL